MLARHPTGGRESLVSLNSKGSDLMQEIYLKSLAAANLDGDGSDWGIAITHFPCVVGRHAECAVRIDHPMISRRHCSFFVEGDQIWVEDLRSRNGTTLNGKWLRNPHPVHEGDRLGLACLPFQVRLPTSPTTPVVLPEALEQETEATGPPHQVLVVEDNTGAAAALARLLQNWGHEVRIAHNGPEAIRAAQVNPPDTVLLDICLPGIDGFQVAQQLRAQPDLGKARMVAMTGYGPEADKPIREKGFDRLLTKPVDVQALQEVLS